MTAKSVLLLLLCAVPRETVLRVSWAPPAQLDPQRATSIAESRYIGAMFEGLTVPGPDGVTVREVLAERLGGLGVPVVAGLPVGHELRNDPVALGVPARVEAGPRTATVVAHDG